ncbi:hypothetical protein PPYR_15735 [Photinus pyralis]|uniref:YEATS domain-containing protein n=1 Tax=Photinus pyralis TaxID=7054 RepID=A0A1Y1N690_PHOPY|nr:YEATS domain-containing protein 2 [Photinus pyralis]XP_031359411.1 YEATS domain-containing protein 2 [Photinus pyralis]KAB0789989.1 hypothetical protein PPYR_15735 [Photinus pyralis]
MGSPKKSVPDPDYELTEVAREHVKLKESRETKDTLEKIISIINREFKTELDHRQSQLDLIQQRLDKAQKSLHLLRYILINNYYNGQNMFIDENDDSNSSELHFYNKNGLHPAVKKLIIGNSLGDYKINLNKSPRKKMKYFENQTNVNTTEEIDSKCKIEPSDIVQESNEQEINAPTSKSDSILPISPKEEYDTTRNRKKEKYRIVVGNISKWMPSGSEEDKSTHKWMVYVRGSKEKPDISHFVEKVVFYLHPSYAPNDVVEMRHPPFHLSRRGWGEFPLRVKIFFKYTLNKPVDIIHNLKLDQTFSGQQTLGNETVANLFLYKNEKINDPLKENKNLEPYLPVHIKEEFEDRNDVTVPSEHDYCTAGSDIEPPASEVDPPHDLFKEHSYARAADSMPEEPPDEPENKNAYFINISELMNQNVQEGGSDKLYVTNSSIIAIKKLKESQESFLKKKIQSGSLLLPKASQQVNVQQPSFSTLINYHKYEVHFPKDKFRNCSLALAYLLKKMPLITELGSNLDYKCTYPYVARSLQEYSKWNIGRRLSSEWYQAKMIQKIIVDAKVRGCEKLSPKSIIMYARSHGYTPMANYEIFKKKINPTLDDALENYSEPVINTQMLVADSTDEIVDIIGHTDKNKGSNPPTYKIKIVDKKLELACSYIKQVALEDGIILRPQEIIPGVIFNEVERMIVKALMCLAEEIIRSARANLVYKDHFNESTSSLDVGDIFEVISQRPRFQFLLKMLTSSTE